MDHVRWLAFLAPREAHKAIGSQRWPSSLIGVLVRMSWASQPFSGQNVNYAIGILVTRPPAGQNTEILNAQSELWIFPVALEGVSFATGLPASPFVAKTNGQSSRGEKNDITFQCIHQGQLQRELLSEGAVIPSCRQKAQSSPNRVFSGT